MDEEQVTVPPEVHDELDSLRKSGDLDPNDREGTIEAASDREFDEAAKWLERVGEDVYERAARGRFVAGDGD